MTDTLTPTIRLTEPTPGGDSGTWATLLNSDMAYIDEAINQSVTVSIADVNVVLVADGTVSDQARYLRYNFTGALTANRTVTLPANVKVGWASNNTTGGHNVILSTGSGTTVSLADGSWTLFNCDGANVITQTVRFGALNVAGAAAFSSTGAFTGAVTAANGTSGSQVVNFSQFNPSATGNGYTKLPGGLILQWGSAASASQDFAISFPLVFPTAVFQVVATAQNTSFTANNAVAVSGAGTGGFAAHTSGGLTVNWVAIGN